MTPLASAALAFASIQGGPQSDPGMSTSNAALVSSCQFRGGQSAHLIVPIGSSKIFLSIRNRAGTNDLSVIEYNKSGVAQVETNGGVGKAQFVIKLLGNLIRGPFVITTKSGLRSILQGKSRRSCGFGFQLSPR